MCSLLHFAPPIKMPETGLISFHQTAENGCALLSRQYLDCSTHRFIFVLLFFVVNNISFFVIPRARFCLLPVPSLPSRSNHGPQLGNHWNRLLRCRGSRSYSKKGHGRFVVPTGSEHGQTGKLFLFSCSCDVLEFPIVCLPCQKVQIRGIVNKNFCHCGRGPGTIANKLFHF